VGYKKWIIGAEKDKIGIKWHFVEKIKQKLCRS
jgi:hypothetical protein